MPGRLEASLSNLDRDLAAAQGQSDAASKARLARWRDILKPTIEEVAKLEKQVTALEQERVGLATRAATAEEDAQEAKARETRAQSQISALEQERAALTGRIAAADKETREAKDREIKAAAQAAAQESAHASTRANLESIAAQNKSLLDQHVTLQRSLAEVIAERNLLKDQIQEATTTSRVKIDDVVDDFRRAVAEMNRKAMASPKENEVPVFIDNLEVELKGGINVEDGVKFAPLAGSNVTPEAASTIRFTLKPSVKFRVIDE
jgi:chromosome segregation ATPase